MSESELQSQIIQALRKMSYIALSTSTVGGSRRIGLSKGLPDVFVSHRRWPEGMWMGLEVKTPKGKLKPEQSDLLEDSRIVVVRSLDEALEAVRGK